MPGRGSKKSSNKKTNSKGSKKKSTKPSKSFEKKVKQVIDKEVETKQAFHTLAQTTFNQAISLAGDYNQLVPSIGLGTGDYQRIGGKITAQGLNIRGVLRMIPNETTDSTSFTSAIVRLMVVSNRSISNLEQAAANTTWLTTLLKKGGTTTGFTGVLSDLYAPINRDSFIVHYDKRFYLNQSYLNSVGASPPSVTVAHDIKNIVKFFNINIKCKNKTIKYDQTISSINPINFAPMLLLGYVKPNSSDSIDSVGIVQLQYDTIFNYQDA
jgi:hypothetical protein